jgi:hypothetical protein
LQINASSIILIQPTEKPHKVLIYLSRVPFCYSGDDENLSLINSILAANDQHNWAKDGRTCITCHWPAQSRKENTKSAELQIRICWTQCSLHYDKFQQRQYTRVKIKMNE